MASLSIESMPSGNGKMTSIVILSCMIAGMGGLTFGYDIGVSGGLSSMDSFLQKFFPKVYIRMKKDTSISNYCKFDSQLLTAFTSSLYISGLIASFFASTITTSFGRKPSIILGGTAFLAGAGMSGAAVNIYMIILGRILLGVGIGFTNQVVPLYLSEMAPAKFRGAINNSFELSINLGFIAASLVNYGTEKIGGEWEWRISLALAAVPASIIILGALFLPETPNSLIQRGSNHQKAKEMLQWIRGTPDVDQELQDLIKASNFSQTVKKPFREILKRKYRPQLVMAIGIPFFQQMTGIIVITAYAPLLFRTIGLGESASLMSAVVTGAVGTVFILMAMFTVDRLGRRSLFMTGGFLMIMSQFIVGVVMAVKLGDHGTLRKEYAYLVTVLICAYGAGFGYSWGPLGYLVPSEIFPLEIRSAGQSTTVAVSFFFNFFIAQTLLSTLCHFKAGIFFFFGGWGTIMTVFVYFLLPETMNLPMEQMEQVWREHWFWKRIVGVEKVQTAEIDLISA